MQSNDLLIAAIQSSQQLLLALHSMNHRSQIADSRRAAGRKPILA